MSGCAPPKTGLSTRAVLGLATVLATFQVNPATLEDALLEYPELKESKAMAASFDETPIAFIAGAKGSDVVAAQAALDRCERARQRLGSDRACEILRLNDAVASRSADIKEGTDAPHPLFLWGYENGPTRLYLVGSIHLLKAALYPLPTPIEAAFRQADHVAVEVDIVNADSAAVAQAFAKFAVLSEGPRVEARLCRERRDRLRTQLRRLGIGIADVARLKPLFLAVRLTGARLATFGYLPSHGMEAHFLSRLGDRSIHELETMEQQLALLASPAIGDQVEMLADTLDEMDDIEPTMAQMARAWFLGDDGELLRMFERHTAGSERNQALLEELIDKRNVTLAASIGGLLRKPGTWFVLVGAGHLPGPRGIVALLDADGARGHRFMSDGTVRQ